MRVRHWLEERKERRAHSNVRRPAAPAQHGPRRQCLGPHLPRNTTEIALISYCHLYQRHNPTF
ncbi:hypothetical protein JYU34_007384 [Plutella xylostella]|uniref:Uncharacterized protein n=1 Tax=Plutella xylostella TaxID=51655 RepID=A0ABQ7QQA2_PLUXY|nr:hypothetical protein JYU34_007384 [Plutella xylostella]